MDPEIGCSTLTQPFFFSREEWIPIPQDWAPNIVRGKMYDTSHEIGQTLWSQVQQRLSRLEISPETSSYLKQESRTSASVSETSKRYGKESFFRPRLGQSGFRTLITQAYKKRCAVTGERTLPVLEAAHIQSYAEEGPHDVKNGILLRADLHKLFDKHLITITSNYHIEVSNRIKEEYENGKEYYAYHGQTLSILPDEKAHHPDERFIEWHNNRFYS